MKFANTIVSNLKHAKTSLFIVLNFQVTFHSLLGGNTVAGGRLVENVHDGVANASTLGHPQQPPTPRLLLPEKGSLLGFRAKPSAPQALHRAQPPQGKACRVGTVPFHFLLRLAGHGLLGHPLVGGCGETHSVDVHGLSPFQERLQAVPVPVSRHSRRQLLGPRS